MSLKVVRLLLAVCVSVWLAGGCLLGCGNMAMAAESDEQSTEAAVEGASCHVAQTHHCCSKATTAKDSKRVKQVKVDPKLTESFLALASMPRGIMTDCPLAMRGTAITAKATSNAPDADRAASAELQLSNSNGELPQKHVVAPLVPNRGPTYLRCCVFLI